MGLTLPGEYNNGVFSERCDPICFVIALSKCAVIQLVLRDRVVWEVRVSSQVFSSYLRSRKSFSFSFQTQEVSKFSAGIGHQKSSKSMCTEN